MTQLLVIREYIKNFYTKYEEFIVPLLKFVLGLILFLTINGRMGYMEKIDHVAIVLVAALLCSFLPLGVMVFLSAMFLLSRTFSPWSEFFRVPARPIAGIRRTESRLTELRGWCILEE